MKTEPLAFMPEARSEDIIIKEIDGELLIYDRIRDKAHCLNASAANVWKHCDGQTTTNQIAEFLETETSGSVDEKVVWLALAELRRVHLLEERTALQEQLASKTFERFQVVAGPGVSRREVIRRIGLGVAIALPVVVSITAPTPAQAGSCSHANASCSTGADCCSGTCVPNSPPSVGKHCLGG